MSELLLGCGNQRKKLVTFKEIPEEWSDDFVTLDFDEECKPDVFHDLNMLPLPFNDDRFHEIHAYEVLEHLGTQGDFRVFFNLFEEFYRILKPQGWVVGTCPNWDSVWAFADPGHRRVIAPQTLQFLSKKEYGEHVGNCAMSDYRHCYTADFDLWAVQEGEHNFGFVLRKV